MSRRDEWEQKPPLPKQYAPRRGPKPFGFKHFVPLIHHLNVRPRASTSQQSATNTRSPSPPLHYGVVPAQLQNRSPSMPMAQSADELVPVAILKSDPEVNEEHQPGGSSIVDRSSVQTLPAEPIINLQVHHQPAEPLRRGRFIRGRSASPEVGRSIHGLMTNLTTPADQYLATCYLEQKFNTPVNLTNGSDWDSLSKAIWNKHLSNLQTPRTYKNKLQLWQRLYLYINETFPEYTLKMVGSTMTGLGCDDSDTDLCLIVGSNTDISRCETIAHLETILRHLENLDGIERLKIVFAKVPLLQFSERSIGVDVDMNCNNDVGIRNTYLLKCYSKIDWRVRPLVVIIKLWAKSHRINDAKHNTISSYSLTLMVIHFLQCGVNPPVLPCLSMAYQSKFSPFRDVETIDMNEKIDFVSENFQPIGELLVSFFRYYKNFDFSTYAVSVRVPSALPIEECRLVPAPKNEPRQWGYLCIEEPFNLTNTAHSVYDLNKFNLIVSVINESYRNIWETRKLLSIFHEQ